MWKNRLKFAKEGVEFWGEQLRISEDILEILKTSYRKFSLSGKLARDAYKAVKKCQKEIEQAKEKLNYNKEQRETLRQIVKEKEELQ